MLKRRRQDSLPSSQQDHPTTSNLPSEPSTDTHSGKYTHLSPSPSTTTPIIHCHLPPHAPLSFPSHSTYEAHYQQTHTNRCTSCHLNLPSAHLLNLHITENHDPITSIRRDRGEKTYACFVETCEKVCATWQKRRSHLVDKHGFPREYDFWIVDLGVEGRVSLLRTDDRGRERGVPELRLGMRRAESAVPGSTGPGNEGMLLLRGKSVPAARRKEVVLEKQQQQQQQQQQDTDMDDIVDSVAALQFVPHSVRFARRRQGGGLATG